MFVQPTEQYQNETLIIPQREYTTTTKLYCGTAGDEESTSYISMATGLLNPTFATLLANNVLSVQGSNTNLTYDLKFIGPAVSCMQSDDSDFQLAKKAMGEYEDQKETRVLYFAWVPQPGWGPGVNGSFFASPDVEIANFRLDFESEDAARVFIYLNTTGVSESGKRTAFQEPPSAQMITCLLFNSSYQTHFEVKSTGEQRITAATAFLNWMPAVAAINAPASDPSVRTQMNMQAVMESFGMMVSGPILFPSSDTETSINAVYALGMNPAMYPARQNLTQSQMTERMIKQSEALFQNITLSMRYGMVAGYVSRATQEADRIYFHLLIRNQ